MLYAELERLSVEMLKIRKIHTKKLLFKYTIVFTLVWPDSSALNQQISSTPPSGDNI